MERLLRFASSLIIIAVLCAALTGCGGGGNSNGVVSVVPPGGTVVTPGTPFKGVAHFDEFAATPAGTQLVVWFNRVGFERRSYPIIFVAQDTVTIPGARCLFCKVDPALLAGEGDSGSPVFTLEGKWAGTLSFGMSGDLEHCFVRSADDILNVNATAGATSKSATATVKAGMVPLSYVMSGVTADMLQRYAVFDHTPNHALSQKFHAAKAGNPGAATRAANVYPDPEPGMSVSVNLINGDYIKGGATGTLSQSDGNFLRAFGHEYTRAGACELPVSLAYVEGMISIPGYVCFKQSYPVGPDIGSLVVDQFEGIGIQRGKQAKAYPVILNYTGDSGAMVTVNHRIPNGITSGAEAKYFIMMALAGSLDIKHNTYRSGHAVGTVTVVANGGPDIIFNYDVVDEADITLALEQAINSDLFNLLVPTQGGGTTTIKTSNLVSITATVTVTDEVPATSTARAAKPKK